MDCKCGHPVATFHVTNGTIRHTRRMMEILRNILCIHSGFITPLPANGATHARTHARHHTKSSCRVTRHVTSREILVTRDGARHLVGNMSASLRTDPMLVIALAGAPKLATRCHIVV
eukprot:3806484-Pleurochrysis_carterae.AAC.3